MRITHAADHEWAGVSRHRDTTIVFKRLISGADGSPDNFELALVRMDGRYTTPRHRHNYDQVRLPIEGSLNYAPGKDLKPGDIGYFPEGTHYGPQDMEGGSVSMALQFGGASGQGLLSYDGLRRASAELSQIGTFDAGVFTRLTDDGRKINKDGFEAVWEHATGKPLAYAPARFAEPVLMHIDAFAWQRQGEHAAIKHLGTFGERRVAIEIVRIEAGGTFALAPHHTLLGFVLTGAGHLGDAALAPHDGFELEPGETASIRASEPVEIVLMTLPPVMAAQPVALAAE